MSDLIMSDLSFSDLSVDMIEMDSVTWGQKDGAIAHVRTIGYLIHSIR